MSGKPWLRYLSILIPGLLTGGLATLLAWMQLWTSLPVPPWLSSALFCTGVLAALMWGYVLRSRNLFLSQAWVFLVVIVAGGLAYLFPETLAPGCGGMPKAFASCTTECRTQCDQVCTRWVPLDDPRCTNHPSPWDQGCCLEYTPVCTRTCTTTCWDDPPTVSASLNCSNPGSGGWCAGDASLAISAADPQGYALAISGDGVGDSFFCQSGSCTVPLPQGSGTANFTAIAATSGLTASGSSSWKRDSLAPQLAGSLGGTSGDDGWFLSEASLSASASDPMPGSGLASFSASVDGGAWSAYSGPITLGDGSHSVALRAVDAAGNVNTASLSARVDTQAPQLSLTAPASFCPDCGQRLAVQYAAADATSGIAGWELSADGRLLTSGSAAAGGTFSWNGSPFGPGTHTLVLSAQDAAGNAAETSLAVRLEAAPAPTSGVVMPVPDAGSLVELVPVPSRTPGPARPQSVVVFGGDQPSGQAILAASGPAASLTSGGSPAQPAGAGFPDILWGAAAVAASTAALVYAQEQREKSQPRVTVTVKHFAPGMPGLSGKQVRALQAAHERSERAARWIEKHPEAVAKALAAKPAAGPSTAPAPPPPRLPTGISPEAQAAFAHSPQAAQWISQNAGKLRAEYQAQVPAQPAKAALKVSTKQDAKARAQDDDPWWKKAWNWTKENVIEPAGQIATEAGKKAREVAGQVAQAATEMKDRVVETVKKSVTAGVQWAATTAYTALQNAAMTNQARAAYTGPVNKPANATGVMIQPLPGVTIPKDIHGQYFVNQEPAPWPSKNECVTAATIQLTNMTQDIITGLLGLTPIPHTDLKTFASVWDTKWPLQFLRPPASVPFFGGMLPPQFAEKVLEGHSDWLRDKTGCGYDVELTTGNSVDDLISNLQNGYPTTLHVAQYISKPEGKNLLPALLGGLPHTVTLAGYNANTDEWYILDPGNKDGLTIWHTPELTDNWGRHFLFYPPRFAMTTVIPDVSCTLPSTTTPTPAATTVAPVPAQTSPPQAPGAPPSGTTQPPP